MQRPGEYGTAGTSDTGEETVSDLSFMSHLANLSVIFYVRLRVAMERVMGL